MTIDEFKILSRDEKALLLIFSGEMPSLSSDNSLSYNLYFFKKFYFEEVVQRSTNTVVETNQVHKFAHFKSYLQAIRAEKLPQ